MDRHFLVLAAQPWAQSLFRDTLRYLPGDWNLAADPVQADMLLNLFDGEWHRVFVLHWHWILKPEVTARYTCVGFHASDLPHFRGGDPIGNQIKRGVLDTQLTAFRLDAGIDTGPVILKLPLSLVGTKEEILERCAGLVARLIPRLAYRDLLLTPQPEGGSFYRREDAR